jgi:hypothetical protein
LLLATEDVVIGPKGQAGQLTPRRMRRKREVMANRSQPQNVAGRSRSQIKE